MTYTEMMQVEEQTMSDTSSEEWDYFFDALDRADFGKYQSQPNQTKKLILK